jgi:hypothetical protein
VRKTFDAVAVEFSESRAADHPDPTSCHQKAGPSEGRNGSESSCTREAGGISGPDRGPGETDKRAERRIVAR